MQAHISMQKFLIYSSKLLKKKKRKKSFRYHKDGLWEWLFRTVLYLTTSRAPTDLVYANSPSFLPNSSSKDRVHWIIAPNYQYSTSATWNFLGFQHKKVAWHNLIWLPNHISRNSFILWLAIKERLHTKDKLRQWGTISDASCYLSSEGAKYSATFLCLLLFWNCQVL